MTSVDNSEVNLLVNDLTKVIFLLNEIKNECYTFKNNIYAIRLQLGNESFTTDSVKCIGPFMELYNLTLAKFIDSILFFLQFKSQYENYISKLHTQSYKHKKLNVKVNIFGKITNTQLNICAIDNFNIDSERSETCVRIGNSAFCYKKYKYIKVTKINIKRVDEFIKYISDDVDTVTDRLVEKLDENIVISSDCLSHLNNMISLFW